MLGAALRFGSATMSGDGRGAALGAGASSANVGRRPARGEAASTRRIEQFGAKQRASVALAAAPMNNPSCQRLGDG